MEILETILSAKSSGSRLLALLLDPEKANLDKLSLSAPDMIFVGGSTGDADEDFLTRLRTKTSLPLVLFPGSSSQFSPMVDAVLFLSLLSGRNPEMLVGQQVRAARAIRRSSVESIPMGYILVDGGVETSVMRVSGTMPISQTDIDTIVDTAIAAELLGKKLIYLEAGSGAKVPVSQDIIRAVCANTTIPVIVGGGIRTIDDMRKAYEAGATLVVIGNHFESHPDELSVFYAAKTND